MKMTYNVAVVDGLRYECRARDDQEFAVGDQVVIQFEKYKDAGVIKHACSGAKDGEGGNCRPGDPEGEIVRQATPSDQAKVAENATRADSMFRTAQRKIGEHNLPMKLILCHYALDKSLAIFLFSSEGRVDFRNLVRDLSGALHTRIELRQIGVRDEAAIHGGIGLCGRAFCCATVLKRFETVNVKMAKVQRLSLNPSSVSGGCGRLKCCLRYEADGYAEMFRNLPRNGAVCETPEGCGRVTDCNALTRKVRVRLEGDGAQIVEFDADDVQTKPRGPKKDSQ